MVPLAPLGVRALVLVEVKPFSMPPSARLAVTAGSGPSTRHPRRRPVASRRGRVRAQGRRAPAPRAVTAASRRAASTTTLQPMRSPPRCVQYSCAACIKLPWVRPRCTRPRGPPELMSCALRCARSFRSGALATGRRRLRRRLAPCIAAKFAGRSVDRCRSSRICR